MARYIVDVDLVGSSTTETIEADSAAAAASLVSVMWPQARSVTVAGLAGAEVREGEGR